MHGNQGGSAQSPFQIENPEDARNGGQHRLAPQAISCSVLQPGLPLRGAAEGPEQEQAGLTMGQGGSYRIDSNIQRVGTGRRLAPREFQRASAGGLAIGDKELVSRHSVERPQM